MARKFFLLLACVVAGIGLAGCRKKAAAYQAGPSGYFHTPFQTETEFVVDAIVSDLAEQMYFAANHRLPDQKYFSVIATEKGGTDDQPVLGLTIRLEPKKSDVAMDLKIDGPIWSPEVYQPVAKQLADAIDLSPGDTSKSDDTSLISKLLDGTAETIEEQNEEVSDALQDDFANPDLHEKAALVLGAFVLREHSRNFFEIRSPLSRITAHLAMAQFLRGSQSLSINGQLAKAMMLTMANNEIAALDQLKNANTDDPAIGPMVRGLRARITGDYRPLNEVTNRTPFEDIQWFWAMSTSLNTANAWPKLTEEQKQNIDFERIANDGMYSVEIGNQLLQNLESLELRELQSIYEKFHPNESAPADLKKMLSVPSEFAKELNVLPEHCFHIQSDGKAKVDVIGWGQWAMFFQRHLCSAIQQNYYRLDQQLGLPDDAKKYAVESDKYFGDLTLYTFVRRFDCNDEQSYHKAEDDGFNLTVEMPQFVPATCWNFLCYRVSFAPLYVPSPNPHVNEWHNHNPLPGTVYDLQPRLDHPSLTQIGTPIQRFEAMREIAPYDTRISHFLAKNKYKGTPTYDEAMSLYHDTLPYSPTSLGDVAKSVYGDPQRYVELMTRAAEMDPRWYYALGNYLSGTNSFANEDKAAAYFQKAYDADQDRVRASNQALWLVRYYLKHGRTAMAESVAKDAGEAYSFGGLEAQAWYFEGTSNYDSAFEWYSKIEERYASSYPVLYFCYRYREKVGHRYDAEMQKRAGKLFPKGIEKVSLNDFKDAPAYGVLIRDDSTILADAGMKKGDIIVALDGIRVYDVEQFTYARALDDSPEMDVIVWHDGAYKESKSSPPDHRYGVRIGVYPPPQ